MKRLLVIAGTVLASTTMIVSGIAPAGAAPSAGSGSVKSIVYSSITGGIWVVKGDGTGVREIGAATPDSISFAPDGVRLAYSTAGEVWTTSTAGATPRQLTHTGGRASGVAWSPNGRWIAFDRDTGNGSDIYRVPATGGAATRIAFGGAHCNDFSPAWSPDSTTIAYVRDNGSDQSCPPSGLVVQRLGHPGQVVVPGQVRGPSFTPTGNLVYLAACPQDVCGADVTAGWEANADGSGQTIVQFNNDCQAGDECLAGMIGSPAARGWIEETEYAESDDPNADRDTCFQGAYQRAGAVTLTAPNFCLSQVLIFTFDAA